MRGRCSGQQHLHGRCRPRRACLNIRFGVSCVLADDHDFQRGGAGPDEVARLQFLDRRLQERR
eukprot:4054799-Lingulodinium_polyedra.AAC.1